jgi:hypothetical protein
LESFTIANASVADGMFPMNLVDASTIDGKITINKATELAIDKTFSSKR